MLAVACCGCLADLPACETAPEAPPPRLPVYSPADAALFDDTFSVDVFDSPAIDAPFSMEKLQEQVVMADSVQPARISTVTRDTVNTIRGFTLTLKPVGPPLAGLAITEPIQVAVTRSSPSFVRVRSAETTLVGKPIILMFRRYELNGSETLHWRAELDTEAVRTAISKATAVRAGRAPD